MTQAIRPAGKTLAAVVAETAHARPAAPAIFYEDRCVSYGELYARAVAAAKGLLGLGVKRGDRIGVVLGNEPDFVVMDLAAGLAGAGFVPLNTWYKAGELKWTAAHCGLSVIVAARRFLKTDYGEVLEALRPELPELRHLVFTSDPIAGALSWSDFIAAGEGVGAETLAAAHADPEATALVLYTSGSTAEPKGVRLAHRGVVENGFELGQRREIGPEDRVWIASPLFYALGATNALPAALTAGASIVLQGAFEAGRAIETVRRTEATVYYGTGNMTRAILDHPDYAQRKIGSLVKGNAGTMTEYKRMTLLELGIRRAVPAYGLTETYGNATVGLADDPVEVKLATDGLPVPGMEMVIVDPDTGARLPQGAIGLVLVRGHTTPGYLNNPVETQKVLRPDGFFDTGDLGSFDGDGRFIFHARLKEVIKSGGINISPMEVEQLIAAHPDVRDAFVVGVADPVLGERIVAFVDAAHPVSEASLKSYVRETAASFKTPHHIFFRTEGQLPRLASGKVAKHTLAAEARRELGL